MMYEKLLSMSLLVVEDDENTRKQLVDVLTFYFEDVISAMNGCDGIKEIEKYHPSIIISDIKMSCIDGIEMVRKVKNQDYRPIVILTTAFSDQEYLLDALDVNVDGYLIKPIDINILISKIIENINSIEIHDIRYKKLSQREYEVFLDLAKGLKPSEIALKYSVKPKTISTYRNRIFEKMSFHTNAELIAYAIKNNLI